MKVKSKIFVFLIFFIFWQILSLLVDKAFLPSPLATLDGLITAIEKGLILKHALISLMRIVLSLLISLLFALAIGIPIGYKEEVYQLLYPLVSSLYPIPKVVFLPVLLLVIIDSVRNLPRDLYISMYSLSQSFKDILINLILPYIIPDILTALRICIGTAISVLFFSETFASFDGLGYFILDTMGRREYEQMYGGIIVMSLLGLILYKLVLLIEKNTCHWKSQKSV